MLMSAAMSAQQIYNGNFESWYSPYNPDGWGTWATTVGQFNGALGDSLGRLCRKDSLDHANYPNDTNSVRLMVDTITFPSQTSPVTLAGFIALGGAFYNSLPDTPVGLQFGYYPYTARPDSLIFEYKYIPAAGSDDTAIVVMTMNRYDSAAGNETWYIYESWLLSPVDSWTHVALPLDYLIDRLTDTLRPDSIQLYVISSLSQIHRGTTLWLDTIRFDASVDIIDSLDTFPAGISNIQNIRGVKAYPNPADAALHILVQPGDVGSGIELYDAEGRQAYRATIDNASYTIDTRCLPDGVYSLRVYSTDRLTVYTGRITVVHRE